MSSFLPTKNKADLNFPDLKKDFLLCFMTPHQKEFALKLFEAQIERH